MQPGWCRECHTADRWGKKQEKKTGMLPHYLGIELFAVLLSFYDENVPLAFEGRNVIIGWFCLQCLSTPAPSYAAPE
jgi:hypothetical protein